MCVCPQSLHESQQVSQHSALCIRAFRRANRPGLPQQVSQQLGWQDGWQHDSPHGSQQSQECRL
jgi:hypothetical protein